MVSDTAARIQAVCVPILENRLAKLERKWAYPPGTPGTCPRWRCRGGRVRLSGQQEEHRRQRQ